MGFETDFAHRRRLIHASIDEFEAHGYDGASLNRILSAAGMSKGQLYHHFTNKQDLFVSLVEWTIAEKRSWIEANLDMGGLGDFFDLLRFNMAASIAFTRQRPEIDRFSRALLAERGRPIFELVTDRVGFGADGPLDALITNHHAAGTFGDTLPLDFLRRLVPVLLNNLPELLDLDQPADLEPRIDQLISWLRRSLG